MMMSPQGTSSKYPERIFLLQKQGQCCTHRSNFSWENKKLFSSRSFFLLSIKIQGKKIEIAIPPFSDNKNKCLLISPYLDRTAYLGDVVTHLVSRVPLFAKAKIAFEQPSWTLGPSSIM